tara:strand:- start:56 stop:250 length:195 start_codon:yes stop_codon:yes gene_type:complete
MDNVNKETFSKKISVELLPIEMLAGIRFINCKVLCDDEKYRPLVGLELGFIFFKLTFAYIKWEK